MNNFTFLKVLQPAIICVLIILVFVTSKKVDSAIEEETREFKRYSDSLTIENQKLLLDISDKQFVIDDLLEENVGLERHIEDLDNSIRTLSKAYYEEIDNIDYISADSNLVLLSKFLSKASSD